ncbi:hypothetical protein KI387_022968, partial [Taxus chinensis]
FVLYMETFDCEVYLCSWHVRCAWLKNLIAKVREDDVRCIDEEMANREAIKFIDKYHYMQPNFFEYWEERWLHKIAMWSRKFKVEKIENISWVKALQIPDYHVTFHTTDNRIAWVQNQKDGTFHYQVYSVTPLMSMCCTFLFQAYTCKHVIKVGMMRERQGVNDIHETGDGVNYSIDDDNLDVN